MILKFKNKKVAISFRLYPEVLKGGRHEDLFAWSAY